MFQIKTLNNISPAGLSRFDIEDYKVGNDVEHEDGIILRSASMHEMEFDPNLKAVARAGAGVNNIPTDKCAEQGIVVFNTPGANANAVKELVMTGLLISARKVYPGMTWVQTLKGEEGVDKLVEKGKNKFIGPELAGKSLGVIGLGAIGIKVANLALHLGMKVYGYDPFISVASAWELSRSVVHAKTLEEIYKNCDFITIHVPQNKDTKGLINAASIRSMKQGVRILNFARGGLVNDDDMLEALDEGNVRCYVTDFPNEKLLGHKGVLAIPHLGASTPESEDNCARMAADELIDFLENGNIKNSVNFPNVSLDRSGDARIGCIHKNMPNVISQISGCFGAVNANIENMVNKSRGDFAYTLIDVNGEVTKDIVEKLSSIEGVIRVNVYK